MSGDMSARPTRQAPPPKGHARLVGCGICARGACTFDLVDNGTHMDNAQ